MVRIEAIAAPISLGLGLALFATGFVSQVVSVLASSHADGGPLVWLPGGILLAVLMSVAPSRWVPCVIGIVFGVALAASLPDGSIVQNGTPLVLTLALIPLGAHGMRALCADTSPMRTFRNLAGFVGLFVIALPIASSAAELTINPNGIREQDFESAMHFALADALGYLLFAPMWFRPRARWSTLRRMFVPDSWPALAALASLATIWFLWNTFGALQHVRPLLLLAPIPVVVFTALRARVAGAYALVVLIAIVAILLSREGRGPFVESDASLTALSFMSWILGAGVASWLLAVLIEQRVHTRRALAHSSREVRELSERLIDAQEQERSRIVRDQHDLAGRLLEAQEQERSRIARDLHDDVNQRLASVSIELSAIRRGVDAQSRADLGHLQDELIALSEDVRHISHNLHPSMLRETGLDAALALLCNTQRHRNGPSIELHVMPDADHLPAAISLCLYRASQEALGNAIRHGRARNIAVTVGVLDRHVELRIDDDGIGFSTTDGAARARGLGLLSLDERSKLLGGSFDLETGPGKGTHICIRLPLPSHPLR